MCDQLPDNLILDGRNVSIESLPVLDNNYIGSVPEKAMPISTGHYRGYVADWVNGIIRPAAGSCGETFEILIENGKVLNAEIDVINSM